MAKTDVWMPLYIGDYIADTGRLTTEQHGAYLLLIMDYWRNGPPPDDDSILAQITRMSPDAWSNARSTVRAFFNAVDGVLRHQRIDEEIRKAQEAKTKAVDKAKSAASKRWSGKQKETDATSNTTSNPTSNACGNAQAMLGQCPSPSPSPITPPNGGEGNQPKRGKQVTFNQWLEQVKAAGEKAMSDYAPVSKYAEDVGIPLEWIELAWLLFRRRYSKDANYKGKKYIDWRQVFENAVRGNWMGVWYAKDGQFFLSTIGQQAQLEFKEAA